MGLIAPTVPTVGQPRGSEEVDVLNALNTIIAAVNGNIDAANLAALAVTPSKMLGHDAVVSSLPVAPVDGQECFFLADAANGVVWALKYRAASASAFKWEFIGGPPLSAIIATSESTASITYVALTTAGPTVTAPLAGDYAVLAMYEGISSVAANGFAMSYQIGATAASDGDRAVGYSAVASGPVVIAHELPKLGIAAATAFSARYRAVTGGTATFVRRQLFLRPIRVG
jgi:hypothetical protein